MTIKINNKKEQQERLMTLCKENGVAYKSLDMLLDSVKAKKIKRVNYHQQKIADIIEKNIK